MTDKQQELTDMIAFAREAIQEALKLADELDKDEVSGHIQEALVELEGR